MLRRLHEAPAPARSFQRFAQEHLAPDVQMAIMKEHLEGALQMRLLVMPLTFHDVRACMYQESQVVRSAATARNRYRAVAFKKLFVYNP